MSSKKNILVTGASGFLGSHVVSHLEKNKESINLIKYSFRHKNDFQNNYTDLKNILLNSSIDYFINCGASQNDKDDELSIEDLIISNTLFPASVLSTIKHSQLKTHFINFGSSWEVNENFMEDPFNAYAASKTAVNSFFKHFSQCGVKITNLMLFDTYGPNDKRRKVLNLVIDAMIKNEDLNMSLCQQAIDLIYIDDVLDCLDFIMDDNYYSLYPDNFNFFQVRSGNILTLDQIVDETKVFFPNYSGTLNKGFYPYRDRERFKLNDFKNKLPPLTKPTTLRAGLKKTIDSRKI
jgi:nucleoside-diphosphate-sugar epimerase